MAVAAATHRRLLVVWVSDAHANCSVRSLFDGPLPFALLEEDLPIAWLPTAGRWVLPDGQDGVGFQAFNYMPGEEGAVKRLWVRIDHSRHLFVRSAYRVAHERGGWEYTMHKLRALRPLPAVQSRLVADSSMVGLHVRGVVDAISDYGVNGTAALATWRSKTAWPVFVERLRREPRTRRFFLAADSHEAYEGLSRAFPGQIVRAERPASERVAGVRVDLDRGCAGMEQALVDLLNLARCGQLLGSHYSSFSEVARYYGRADWLGNPLPFEAAGLDF